MVICHLVLIKTAD